MAADPEALRRPSWPVRLAAWEATGLSAAVLVAAVFLAIVIPYRNWDALDIGSWSRTIAAGGFHHGIYDFQLQKPLFYVAQGLLWRGIGYHEATGRILSLSFSVVLTAGVWILAGRLTDDERGRRLLRALALTILLASSAFTTYAISGLSDIPLAAATCGTAVLLVSKLGRARLPLVAAAAAATVLAKPSGLIALAGLALACVLFLRDPEKRRRALLGLIGIAFGAFCALGYDAWEAHRLDESLSDFLFGNANWDYWRRRAASTRAPTIIRGAWLGDAVSLLVLHGLVFGVARALGLRLRLSLLLAAVAATTWTLAGPMVADGEAPRLLQDAPSLVLLAYLALVAALVGAAYADPQADVLPRRTYVALLLWAAPATLAWAVYRTDEPRLLSPAWPPLVLLAGASLTAVTLALLRRSTLAGTAAVAAVGLLALTNLPSLDGFSRASWQALLDKGPSGWDRTSAEQFAWGPFYDEVTAVDRTAGPEGRIVTQDGRLRYLFPGRAQIAYPRRCSEVAGARVFVLLLDAPAQFVIRANHAIATQRAWESCRSPRLQRVAARRGGYVVFRVGGG
jgi:hypothetical protein